MFERLALADIVIADISIHNANVYYELGIRHSLRPRTTVLIRSRASEVPFDLKTDRYLEYSAEDPVAARSRVIVFSGHRIDAPGRPEPTPTSRGSCRGTARVATDRADLSAYCPNTWASSGVSGPCRASYSLAPAPRVQTP